MSKSEKLILGTVQMGMTYGVNSVGRPGPNEVLEILSLASAQGITTLDTANSYGDAMRLIGEFHIKNPQHQFIINSKVKAGDDLRQLVNHVTDSCEKMNVKGLETLLLHRFADIENNPFLDKLLKLKETGIVKKIGISIYTLEEFKTVLEKGLFDVIQLPFNLVDHSSHKSQLMTEAHNLNYELQARSIFLQGLIFKSVSELSGYFHPLAKPINELNNLAKDYKLSMAAMALNYALSQEQLDKVLIGVDTSSQLRLNCESLNVPLPQELINAINEIVIGDTSLLNPVNWP